MWASLVSLGFKNVDMVLPHPTISNRAFFFSGDNYGEIEFTPSMSDHSCYMMSIDAVSTPRFQYREGYSRTAPY